MKYHLILTIDYELFGNGSGCLHHCVSAPTQMCLQTLEQFNAKLAFFADASEFLALKKYPQTYSSGMQEVEQQLIDALRSGHSLQLHLHPQWMGAEYRNGVWHLDTSKWRIGDLSEQEISQCVSEGLEYLKALAKQSDSDQNKHCKVFRAGGWAIQPSEKVLRVLESKGIELESTVAPGANNPSRGDWYDFRGSSHLPYWSISKDVCASDAIPSGKLIEVPIATAKVGRFQHAKALKQHRSAPGLPEGCSGSYDGPNTAWQSVLGKLNKMWQMGTVMLDFSTMPGWMLVEITKLYQNKHAQCEQAVPIVAIGHNKNFTRHSNANLQYWLAWLAQQEDIKFSSYTMWQDACAASILSQDSI